MRTTALLLVILAAGCRSATTPPAARPSPGGVPGVTAAELSPAFWVARAPAARSIILPPEAIARQNQALTERDSSIYDLERLPAQLSAATVRGWITRLSQAPSRQLYDERGDSVTAAQVQALLDELALDAIADGQAPRFGLVVHRADLRTFPTRRRVFSSRGNTDIDRWQESAAFPGAPAAVVHQSRDGQWLFVVTRHYAAWVEAARVAMGPRELVFGYGRKEPFLVVTGAKVRTVFNPELAAVSDLQLDMGVRLPLLADWPADRPVHGQNPYTGHVIELPVRGEGGALAFAPALLPRTADVSPGYLPLTGELLLRQSFKFLGERYGWGHSYNGRDCSGFVGEVYRSFGIDMPRNTGDQAVSPAMNRVTFTAADTREARLRVLREARVGDMIYIPGHTMMVIGHVNGEPYIIHDVTGVSFRGADGTVSRIPLNQVAVTPLVSLASGDATWVERMTSIVRMRP